MASPEPENFSWVIPGLLAGSALPFEPGHLQYLLDVGIKHLVSLTEWNPPVLRQSPKGLNHIHMPVTEFEPPSLQQAVDFVNIVQEAKDKHEGVVVHCHWGRGRTGTMIACFLVKDHKMPPQKAIDFVRECRPYSIETHEQERLVFQYHKQAA